MQRSKNTYTSPVIQNELLTIMGTRIQLKIASNVKSTGMYSLMMDETTDVNNKEQLVLCLRWVDREFVPHEDCLGIFAIPDTGNIIYL